MDTLIGSVERLTFYNPDNGYSVVRLKPERGRSPGMGQDGLVTVTGNLPELAPGEHLRLQGKWTNHPKHGLQFQVEICEQILPATVAGLRRYLGSGLIRGIGPRLADRILPISANARWSDRSTSGALLQVEDIGPAQRSISAAWEEQTGQGDHALLA
jgi:exodeoxyribonuclease V alpha subunit